MGGACVSVDQVFPKLRMLVETVKENILCIACSVRVWCEIFS